MTDLCVKYVIFDSVFIGIAKKKKMYNYHMKSIVVICEIYL